MERLEISRVLSRSFDLIGKHFVLFLILSLLFAGLPTVATTLWLSAFMLDVLPESVFGYLTSGGFLTQTFGMIVIGMVTNALLQIALTHATARSLEGRAPELIGAVTTAFTLVLPVFILSVIVLIGVMIGTVLLVVPGILLWLSWMVAGPALIQERIGIIAALRRSFHLTDGDFGKLFVLMILLLIGEWLFIEAVSQVVAMLTDGVSPLVSAAAEGVATALTGIVWVTVTVVLYFELVELKEGPATGDLETVFS